MPRYLEYHWFNSDAVTEGVKMFSEVDHNYAGVPFGEGLTRQQALECMNLWNQGEHHRYRYWMEF